MEFKTIKNRKQISMWDVADFIADIMQFPLSSKGIYRIELGEYIHTYIHHSSDANGVFWNPEASLEQCYVFEEWILCKLGKEEFLSYCSFLRFHSGLAGDVSLYAHASSEIRCSAFIDKFRYSKFAEENGLKNKYDFYSEEIKTNEP